MTAKYEHIATITLDSSASSVTFSSIPQGYRDLELVTNAYASTTGNASFYLNSDTGANYARVRAYGTGSSTNSDSGTGRTGMNSVLNWIGNTPNVTVHNFMDYSATDKDTTVLSRINNDTSYAAMQANSWDNTAGVTTIKIESDGGDFLAGSTFDLYGIVGGA